MARSGRPNVEPALSDDECAVLEGWLRRLSAPQAWVLRCRIILVCADGVSSKEVAVRLRRRNTRWGAGNPASLSTVLRVSGA